ncbi:MAG: hypothetical protein Q4E57_00220 [Eubacteriales bacterium]|nr:hypothetical protein [Eubacteriales bacterium]
MKKLKKTIIMAAALGTSAAISFAAYAAVVEVDEYGVAYVLNDDGTKDYNNVPPQDNSPENAEAAAVLYDTNSYDWKAEETGFPGGMSAERYAALCDNVIEWDEISDLITYWNPTYVKYYNQANSNIQELRNSYDEFSSQMKDQLETLDVTMEDLRYTQQNLSKTTSSLVTIDGVTMPKEAALNAVSSGLSAAGAGQRSIISSLGSTKRSLYLAGSTVRTALAPVKNQMISVVESLVISYKTLEVNRSMVAQQVELYRTLYNMQANMQAQNMATQAAASSYLNQLNTAQKTLTELDSGLAQLKKNIAVQCGYDINTDITIADLPEPDTHYLDGRSYEADKKQAVDGNSTVISAGSLSNYEYSSYGMELRDMGENEARGKASAAMDSIGNELQRQAILVGATETSLRKAELTANAAEVKYSLGMLSNAEYESLRMQYISYKAAAAMNKLNLHQAIENYKWAMMGVMSVG